MLYVLTSSAVGTVEERDGVKRFNEIEKDPGKNEGQSERLKSASKVAHYMLQSPASKLMTI